MIFRVLVVDDSDFTREALRRALETEPSLKVVGEAKTGEEAVELARKIRPHLITMDLSMPGMGGLKAIEKIMAQGRVPLVVISERSYSGTQDLNVEAMNRGALELVPKADVFGGAEMSLQRFALRMRQLAEAGLSQPGRTAPLPSAPRPRSAEAPLLIGLGASTGGPRALAQVLGGLPAVFPVPIAIVQHMAPDFFDSFLTFLSSRSKQKIVRAEGGMKPAPGAIHVAPPGFNLTVDRDLVFQLTAAAGNSTHGPSVDALFTTMARSLRGRAVGVLMTGMGADGAQGLLALRKSGARTIAQDAASCAVAGMPLAALAIEAAEEVIELKQIAHTLNEDLKAYRGEQPKLPGAKKRILIVDDSPLLLAAGKHALEDAGYEVKTLENPLMVAMLLRKNPVDLVLLDVNMPTVKGTQVVTSLRAHGLNATPVILYSDLSERELSAKATECGATGWLRKTGDEQALIRAIDGWVGAKGSR